MPLLNSSSPDAPGVKNAVWYLPLSLGEPAVPLNLLFDTGSALAWVRRNTAGCGDAQVLYNPLSSRTAVDTAADMHFVYGEGAIDGRIYEDDVHLGGTTFRLPWGWVPAIDNSACFDGLIGADMESSFFLTYFNRTGDSPRFGLAGSGPTRSAAEVTLGAYDMSAIRGGIACVPAVPTSERSSPGQGATVTKWWQVAVSGGVTVGGAAVHAPGLQAIVDTGCGAMNGSPAVVQALFAAIGASEAGDCTGMESFPPLTFHLSDGVALTFEKSEYTAQVDGRCKMMISSIPGLSDEWFVFGAPLWWKYYTAFDYETGSVGFGLLHDAAGEALPQTCALSDAERLFAASGDADTWQTMAVLALGVLAALLSTGFLISKMQAEPTSFEELASGPC